MTDLPSPALVAPGIDDARSRRTERWEPVALRRSAIEQAIKDLLAEPRADAEYRRRLVVHPRAEGQGGGLAPSIRVSIEALAVGEVARPPRRNSAALAHQLSGATEVEINGETSMVRPRDTYSIPPFAIQTHRTVGDEPSVRLVFSNAALLEFLGAHHTDAGEGGEPLPGAIGDDFTVHNPDRIARLGAGDSWRLEYERVIDPPWVALRSWLWRWDDVAEELDRMGTLDDRYHGRRVCVLHDPVTGRTNGTTPTLFASMCIRPAGIVDRTHRHSAAAVNYFFEGSGWSTVDGQRIEWEAGDLIFIAPAWAVHHHTSGDEPVYQLAVQDNPLHLAMGSLVWQEDLAVPSRLLGAEPGFSTNRDELEGHDP